MIRSRQFLSLTYGYYRLLSRKPISSFVVDTHKTPLDDNRPQVCNPPMVHCLAWSPTGQSLAAGLGDGTIEIFSIEQGNRLVQTAVLSEGAHGSSVVSVVYPSFSTHNNNNNSSSSSSSNVSSSERILCSAGSDGSILFWDLGSCSGSPGEWRNDDNAKEDHIMNDVTELFAKSLCVDSTGEKQKSDESLFGQLPSLLFGIPHGRKMNWVTRATSIHQHGNSIFVADTSSDITCYTVPMR